MPLSKWILLVVDLFRPLQAQEVHHIPHDPTLTFLDEAEMPRQECYANW